jgi:hypothetical protein
MTQLMVFTSFKASSLITIAFKKTHDGYSLHTGNWSRFGQRHCLQIITLTSYFYKKYLLKSDIWIFYESIFQDKSIHMVLHFQTQQ